MFNVLFDMIWFKLVTLLFVFYIFPSVSSPLLPTTPPQSCLPPATNTQLPQHPHTK